jgi:hypothetical protein
MSDFFKYRGPIKVTFSGASDEITGLKPKIGELIIESQEELDALVGQYPEHFKDIEEQIRRDSEQATED